MLHGGQSFNLSAFFAGTPEKQMTLYLSPDSRAPRDSVFFCFCLVLMAFFPLHKRDQTHTVIKTF